LEVVRVARLAQGQAAWKETVVADALLHADYIQLALP